jgi:hypothetical protein
MYASSPGEKGFARVDAVETFANGLAATLVFDLYTPKP